MSYIVTKGDKRTFTIIKASSKLGVRKVVLCRGVSSAKARQAIALEGKPIAANGAG